MLYISSILVLVIPDYGFFVGKTREIPIIKLQAERNCSAALSVINTNGISLVRIENTQCITTSSCYQRLPTCGIE